MLGTFFKNRKYKKMIRVSASSILEDIAEIIDETIEHFEKKSQLDNSTKKEFLKLEATALLFWLFKQSVIFPEIIHKLLLDEIHNQYYDQFKKRGYNFKMRQLLCDSLNLRYKTYDDAFTKDQDLLKVSLKFVKFLSEKSKTDLNMDDMMIATFLIEKSTEKFKELKEIIR